MSTLYEKIGGQPTIEKVVDDFHKRILADSSVSGFFSNTDMEKQRDRQIGFFSLILGGPKTTKVVAWIKHTLEWVYSNHISMRLPSI